MADDERAIDPAGFRTRAFATFWDGMLRYLPRRSRASLRTQVRSSQLYDLLTSEADRWLELGVEIGYFTAEPSPFLRRHVSDFETFFSMAPAATSPLEFQAEVAYAQETLSVPHFQMLQLLHFTGEEEWEGRIEQVRNFASLLERQPRWRPTPEWLEAIQWALGDEETEEHVNPAFWRLGGLGRYGFGTAHEQVDERAATLERLRARIAGAIEQAVALETAAEESPLSGGLLWLANLLQDNPEGGEDR
jgi:hypothetical protein